MPDKGWRKERDFGPCVTRMQRRVALGITRRALAKEIQLRLPRRAVNERTLARWELEEYLPQHSEELYGVWDKALNHLMKKMGELV